MGRLVAASLAGVVAGVVLLVAAATGALSALTGGGPGAMTCAPSTPAGAPVAGLTGEQWRNAIVIVQTGQSLTVPAYGWVVAVATALQESDLVNLGNLGPDNDHDSLGLFQQRPSMGWGTPEQIMNPAYASRKFYEALSRVDGWQNMPVTVAAQAVQRSVFPDAYAKHEGRARQIMGALSGSCLPIPGGAWVAPVRAPIVSGFHTHERPNHHGVDLGARRGTPILAASSGVVVTVVCNVNGATYSQDYRPSPCDVDGSIGTGGCGWMVTIKSADQLSRSEVTTVYCHLLRSPLVHVGQRVRTGEVIGVVGTSGNSSGPHLHYEVRVDGRPIDPVEFMRVHGAPLGNV